VVKLTEHQHQVLVVEWFRIKYPMFKIMATPNGGFRHIKTAVYLKKEGASAGFPDLFIAAPCGMWHGLFIEMKKVGGHTSDAQNEWIEYLNAVGYFAIVCHGFDAAKAIIEFYIGGAK
jgi:hypothetical protein